MKEEFLLVDGYNLINAWDELKDLASLSLESARVRLLDILCNYQGFKGIEVIVVFDGHLVKGNPGTETKYNNIYVVYTKEAFSADNYIERSLNYLPKDYKVRVATSDGLEQIITMGKGAVRVSARELYEEINAAEKTIRKDYIENRPPKNNLLSDYVDEKTRRWIEEMRLSKR